MPTFDTPEPISVNVELGVGDIRIVAGDRTSTTVEIRPGDETKKSDVAAAQQTRVEYANGRLLIKGPPKGWRSYSFRGGAESIVVQIGLPSGSQLRGETGVASLHATGRFGECHFKTGVGDLQLDQAGDPVELKTGAGDISVERAAGRADVVTGSGTVRIGTIDGPAVIKNSNGDTWIGEVAGEVSVKAGNGKIIIDRAHEAVTAKSANGDIRLGEVARGGVVAGTAYGKVDVGVSEGVAAWLDLHTGFGAVESDLDPAGAPAAGDEVVEVRARTAFGDITIHRVPAHQTTR